MITNREMQIDDLEQVMTIEEANFTIPWTVSVDRDGIFYLSDP